MGSRIKVNPNASELGSQLANNIEALKKWFASMNVWADVFLDSETNPTRMAIAFSVDDLLRYLNEQATRRVKNIVPRSEVGVFTINTGSGSKTIAKIVIYFNAQGGGGGSAER